jgi:hypothetical protein
VLLLCVFEEINVKKMRAPPALFAIKKMSGANPTYIPLLNLQLQRQRCIWVGRAGNVFEFYIKRGTSAISKLLQRWRCL